MATPFQPEPSLTYREYALLPNDGRRYELVEGDLLENPAPSTIHQRVSRRLQQILMQQLEETGVAEVFNAPTDVILSDSSVVQPDLAIVRNARKAVSERGIEGPPDVIVEILSPGNSGHDELFKKALYARMGVPEYWVIDPAQGLVTAYHLEGGRYGTSARFDRSSTLVSLEFPEVSVPLARLFEGWPGVRR
jgi:Uma2 family endonuclease